MALVPEQLPPTATPLLAYTVYGPTPPLQPKFSELLPAAAEVKLCNGEEKDMLAELAEEYRTLSTTVAVKVPDPLEVGDILQLPLKFSL